ncbi:MAG: hypothetical protein PSY14_08660 [bacterium]|nr:hypothetical protein [bacterium]
MILNASTPAFAMRCRSDCGPKLADFGVTALFVFPISIALAFFFSRGKGSIGTLPFQKYLTCCLLCPALFVASFDLLARYRTPEQLRDGGSPHILFWLTGCLFLIGLHAIFVKIVNGAPTRPQKMFAGWVIFILSVLIYAIN